MEQMHVEQSAFYLPAGGTQLGSKSMGPLVAPVAIDLTQGQVALVSQCDFQLLSQYKWHAVRCRGGRWYAARGEQREGGRVVRIYMHRQILGLGPGRDILADHINGDGLNNTRENLRAVSPSANNRNRQSFKGALRGVFPQNGKFLARVGEQYLGFFETEVEASFAVNKRLRELDGGVGRRNPVNVNQLLAILEGRRDAIQARIDEVRREYL